MECYKVVFSKNGKKVGTKTFNDYEQALDFAIKESDNQGYLCVVLDFNPKNGSWFKRCTIYPNG